MQVRRRRRGGGKHTGAAATTTVTLAIEKEVTVFLFFFTFVCFLPLSLWHTVILVAHFLQSVSSGLVLGGELVYHRGRAEEGGILTLAGQYSSQRL